MSEKITEAGALPDGTMDLVADFKLIVADRELQLKNASPASEHKFGMPLAEISDVGQLRDIADKLWSLLDDIDTLGDMLKPCDEAGYRKHYKMTCKRFNKRHEILESDGYTLFLPLEEGKP